MSILKTRCHGLLDFVTGKKENTDEDVRFLKLRKPLLSSITSPMTAPITSPAESPITSPVASLIASPIV